MEQRCSTREALANNIMQRTDPHGHWVEGHLPIPGYIGLALFVIWSLWLLIFVLDPTAARYGGLFLLVIGILLSLLHKTAGWVMFEISRAFHMDYVSWGGLGRRGAQNWYLGLGLVLIGIGFIYLTYTISCVKRSPSARSRH